MDEKPPDKTEPSHGKKSDVTVIDTTAIEHGEDDDTNTIENDEEIKSVLKKDAKMVDLTLSRVKLDDDIRFQPETKIYIDLGNESKEKGENTMRWEPIHAYYSYSQPGQYPGGGGGGYWGAQQPPPQQAPPYGQQQGYFSSGPRMWGAPEQYDVEYDPKSRNRFVKKIFMLTFALLLFVTLTCITTRHIDGTHRFFRSIIGFGLFISAVILILVIDYAIMCCAYCRTSPCSWIALILTAIAMTYVVAFVTIKYNTPILMVAMAVTAGIVLLCIGLACTSFDFTRFYLYFVLAGLAVALVALIFTVLRFSGIYYKPVHIALTVVVTLVQVVGLVMHLQMILGGRSIEFDEDDIAIPTHILFTSIIGIFLNLLTILRLTDAF